MGHKEPRLYVEMRVPFHGSHQGVYDSRVRQPGIMYSVTMLADCTNKPGVSLIPMDRTVSQNYRGDHRRECSVTSVSHMHENNGRSQFADLSSHRSIIVAVVVRLIASKFYSFVRYGSRSRSRRLAAAGDR